MKYFLDTEFIEKPCTIELISIGIVSEDGRELYLESSDVDLTDVDPWLKENVIPHLKDIGMPRTEIRKKILEFIGEDFEPQFWAYYADYDWVVFCWLFGKMVDLPSHFPKFCMDFKQYMVEHDIPRNALPPQIGNTHDALADASWLYSAYYTVLNIF
jgi:hypothetical protein